MSAARSRPDLAWRLTDGQRARVESACGWRFAHGATIGDVLFAAAQVGRGGHFDELSDESAAALSALSPEEDDYLALYDEWERLSGALEDAVEQVRLRWGGTAKR